MPPKKSLRQLALEKREREKDVEEHREQLKAEGKGTLRHMFLMKGTPTFSYEFIIC
jgi:hypothetical protein